MLTVKRNQPALYDETKELPEDIGEGELEKDHGRIERRVQTARDIGFINGKDAWEDPRFSLVGDPALNALGNRGLVLGHLIPIPTTTTPATIRVAQIDPGPIPTLTASAPASMSRRVPSREAAFPPMTGISGQKIPDDLPEPRTAA